jgi:hypothetical protein
MTTTLAAWAQRSGRTAFPRPTNRLLFRRTPIGLGEPLFRFQCKQDIGWAEAEEVIRCRTQARLAMDCRIIRLTSGNTAPDRVDFEPRGRWV